MVVLDDLLSATFHIGNSIAAVSFPGMFRIYDFHSKKAPKLKSASVGMAMFSRKGNPFSTNPDDNMIMDAAEEEDEADPNVYSQFFRIDVGNDIIYLEDPAYLNDSGWNALHTCCMSFSTVEAGLKLIEELVRIGEELDHKTINGPGSFNSQWTALHMACAYGVEPLALRLLQEKANPTVQNSFGYTPLLEACHRGFVNIVSMLVQFQTPNDIDYIAKEELSIQSPFVSAPAQSALAEAARCGFPRIVQILLDAGASPNNANYLGWTALHEACFYNRIETAKTLLLSGSNASLRTKSGALPYHLSGLAIVREMLKDMGGPSAVPQPGDEIDIVKVLQELTLPDFAGQFDSDSDNDDCEESKNEMKDDDSMKTPTKRITSVKGSTSSPSSSSSSKKDKGNDGDNDTKASPLLHSGPMLGDLPSLTGSGSKAANKAASKAMDSALEGDDFGLSNINRELLLNQKRLKKAKKGRKNMIAPTVPINPELPPDFPTEFLCELSHRPMSDPVESIYGNYFERSVIISWMEQQGKICPLTGGPLSEPDLKPAEELRMKYTKYLMHQSMETDIEKHNSPGKPEEEAKSNGTSTSTNSSPKNKSSPVGKIQNASSEDDLYDF